MKFSEKLILLRKRRGMTQEEFSRAVGVSRQSVYKWESGQSYPEAQKLMEIRRLYGVSIDRLLDDTLNLSFPEEAVTSASPAEAREETGDRIAPKVRESEREAKEDLRETEPPKKEESKAMPRRESTTDGRKKPLRTSVSQKDERRPKKQGLISGIMEAFLKKRK